MKEAGREILHSDGQKGTAFEGRFAMNREEETPDTVPEEEASAEEEAAFEDEEEEHVHVEWAGFI